MAASVDATVGGASANSYVTQAEMTAYVETRLNASTWESDADADTKERALIEACRQLDPLTWYGRRVTDTQALSWPRYYVTNPEDPNGDYFADDEIPVRVKEAQMELAFQFVKNGTTDLAMPETSDGIIRKKIDVLETEYAQPYHRRSGLNRWPRVWDRVKQLVSVKGPSVEVIRG